MNAYTAGCYGVPVVFLTSGLLQELLPRRPAGGRGERGVFGMIRLGYFV